MTTQRDITDVIAAIPRGRIATYGQVAELAGIPRGARVVARVLKACGEGLPWHRVVGKKSANWAAIRIADPVGAAVQRRRLEDEGVVVDGQGRVSLTDYGWITGL